MAFTERYVTADSDGGDGSSGNPWTLVEAMAAAAAGDRVNVKAGTYTLGSSPTPTNSGTAVSPIVWRGYNSSIGDLDIPARSGDNGALVTTNFPVLAGGTTYKLNWGGKLFHIHQNFRVTGSSNNPVMTAAGGGVVFNCSFENSGTGASCQGLANGYVINCDAALTGGSGGSGAFKDGLLYYGCRVLQSQAAGIAQTSSASPVIRCVFINCLVGFDFSSTTAGHYAMCFDSTFYDCDTAIKTAAVARTTVNMIACGNHITDGAGYAVDSAYVATADNPLVLAYNRFRDNSSGNANGFTDWVTATDWGNVTTDTGAAVTDFVAAASANFNLVPNAPAIGKGVLPWLDIGALQRRDRQVQPIYIAGVM